MVIKTRKNEKIAIPDRESGKRSVFERIRSHFRSRSYKSSSLQELTTESDPEIIIGNVNTEILNDDIEYVENEPKRGKSIELHDNDIA